MNEIVATDLFVSGWEAHAREGRHGRLRDEMAAAGIDTLVSTSIDCFAYLTATWCSVYPVVPTRRLFTVVTPDTFFAVASSADPTHLREAGVEDIVTYTADVESPCDALVQQLKARDLIRGTVAIEFPELDAETDGLLTRALDGTAKITDAWPLLINVRIKKDRWELDELSRLGRVMAEATRTAATNTRAGDTEIDFARRANDYAFSHEAVDGGVLVMGSGERAAIHHTSPTHRVMRPGDIVRVDLSRRGPLGYYGDIGRTLFVGDPWPEQEERFHVLAAGLTAIEKALVPGARVGDAADACSRVFEAAGYGKTFALHGHGMGLTLHEEPIIKSDCDVILEPDMVFAAEAVLKIDVDQRTLLPREAYHLESLVRVTEGGNEVLATAGADVLTIAV